MFNKTPRCSTPLAALLALFPLAQVLAQESPKHSRIGWHGEAMPDGLQKASEEKVYFWRVDLGKAGKTLEIEMVYVPPGDFKMGSDDGEEDERPLRTRSLPYGYYIGRYETTWSEYSAFCRAKGRAQPGWNQRAFEKDNEPATGMNWKQAREFCSWAGLKLPSEAEWEKAARGADGRDYPWGNEIGAPLRSSFFPRFQAVMFTPDTRPVGTTKRDVSPFGAYDMGGNVSEWCRDRYTFRKNSNRVVVKGGIQKSALVRYDVVRCSDRRPAPPMLRHTAVGFRPVKVLAPSRRKVWF